LKNTTTDRFLVLKLPNVKKTTIINPDHIQFVNYNEELNEAEFFTADRTCNIPGMPPEEFSNIERFFNERT
jgi:hypothetical protein